jgi:hypothetical protein
VLSFLNVSGGAKLCMQEWQQQTIHYFRPPSHLTTTNVSLF